MIPFNRPPYTGREMQYIEEAVRVNHKISGDGMFTRKCSDWMRSRFSVNNVYLTTSCSHALEMAALLLDIKPGDEVIMPSYTFVSTANAFLLRGAVPVFVDIRPDTMNIDENLIEAAVTEKTKAIVVVHYAGVACEMDTICRIAEAHGLPVVEDAAQGFMASYKGRSLGTIGLFGAYSFHETKNLSMGEGGAIVFQDDGYKLRAEVCREKGTDRSRFFRGEIDKYSWVGMGSSYLPSEINAAYLYAQLERAQAVFDDRMSSWNRYYLELSSLSDEGCIELPTVPDGCAHNAHMFYIKCADLHERTELSKNLRAAGIETVFHYIPLHSSAAGRKYARFNGEDVFTTRESERLLRLPMYYGLKAAEISYITDCIRNFYGYSSAVHAG